MDRPGFPYRIFPLGDTAMTIDFGNCIDERINTEVIARFHDWRQQPLPGMLEAVPAYSSLTVYFDLKAVKKAAAGCTAFEWMKQQAIHRLQETVMHKEPDQRVIRIPVCYDDEFALDIQRIAAAKNISPAEVIQLHTARTYRVFMLGFLPGFAYMGEVDERIAMPRKPRPVNIIAGSVGIAGRQTGIYPLNSPGGWQIIGRTALKLFDAEKDASTLLQAGDRVQFYAIDKKEFNELPRHQQ